MQIKFLTYKTRLTEQNDNQLVSEDNQDHTQPAETRIKIPVTLLYAWLMKYKQEIEK